jgi:hypothetical protein
MKYKRGGVHYKKEGRGSQEQQKEEKKEEKRKEREKNQWAFREPAKKKKKK